MNIQKTRRALACLMAVLAALPMTLLLLLGSVYGFTICKPFYQYEYEKNNTLAVTGADEQTLDQMTDAVIGYLSGMRRDLNLQGTRNGVVQEIFSGQAKTHMADVLVLYQLARTAMLLCAALIALLVLGAVFTAPRPRRLNCLCKGVLAGLAAAALGFGALAFLVSRNFTAAFTRFHKLFFTNDLWLFDASDVLIQMLPTQFFIDVAVGIALVFGFLMLTLLALCIVGVCITGHRLRRLAHGARPDAEEIFTTMAIRDDSAVPPQTKSLLEDGQWPQGAQEEDAREETAPEEYPDCETPQDPTPPAKDSSVQEPPAQTALCPDAMPVDSQNAAAAPDTAQPVGMEAPTQSAASPAVPSAQALRQRLLKL
jgi:integral membrane protein (TIGR01906 family)